MGSDSDEERPDKYITGSNPGTTEVVGQRRFRPSPSWTPQPPRRTDPLDGAGSTTINSNDGHGGSQSVPDISRYFTFYNKDDGSRGPLDDDGTNSDSLDDTLLFRQQPSIVGEDTMTIAETESVAIVHRQASKRETPQLPLWKEILVIVAVLLVPLLAAGTTYILNHYYAHVFDVPV